MFGPKRPHKSFRVGILASNAKKPNKPHVCPFHKHRHGTDNTQSPSPEHAHNPPSPKARLPRLLPSRRRSQQSSEPAHYRHYDTSSFNHSVDLVSHNFRGLLSDSQKSQLYRQLFWEMDYSYDSDRVVRERAFNRLSQIYQEEYSEAEKIIKDGLKERIQRRKAILAKIQKEKEKLLEVLEESSDQDKGKTTQMIRLPPIKHSESSR